MLSCRRQQSLIVVYWPSGFLEAWGTKAKKPHFFRKLLVVWPCRRRRQGQKTSIFLENCVFVGLGTPGLQKNTWPINHYGSPHPPGAGEGGVGGVGHSTVADVRLGYDWGANSFGAGQEPTRPGLVTLWSPKGGHSHISGPIMCPTTLTRSHFGSQKLTTVTFRGPKPDQPRPDALLAGQWRSL